jgi:hypothetical protein
MIEWNDSGALVISRLPGNCRYGVLGTIRRRPENALILRIECPQRGSNIVAEASYAAFDCCAQQSDEGASANRQSRTAQCSRTSRMLGAITFHFFHCGTHSIHRLAAVGSPAIICSHSPFKRKAQPGRMCALVSETGRPESEGYSGRMTRNASFPTGIISESR